MALVEMASVEEAVQALVVSKRFLWLIPTLGAAL